MRKTKRAQDVLSSPAFKGEFCKNVSVIKTYFYSYSLTLCDRKTVSRIKNYCNI